MKRFVTMLIGVTTLVSASAAMAAPVTHAARPYAAAMAYREAVQTCEHGGSIPTDLRQLYRAARVSGYRGYLPLPSLVRQQCEVEAP